MAVFGYTLLTAATKGGPARVHSTRLSRWCAGSPRHLALGMGFRDHSESQQRALRAPRAAVGHTRSVRLRSPPDLFRGLSAVVRSRRRERESRGSWNRGALRRPGVPALRPVRRAHDAHSLRDRVSAVPAFHGHADPAASPSPEKPIAAMRSCRVPPDESTAPDRDTGPSTRVAMALEAPFARHLYCARHVEPRAATAPLE
jgi:hypothetical protein